MEYIFIFFANKGGYPSSGAEWERGGGGSEPQQTPPPGGIPVTGGLFPSTQFVFENETCCVDGYEYKLPCCLFLGKYQPFDSVIA